VDHPHHGGPFFLLLPMNVQPQHLPDFNLDELPVGAPPPLGAAGAGNDDYTQAVNAIRDAERVVVRLGGGAVGAGEAIEELLGLADAAAVLSPVALGTIPDGHPRNMTVGGSKGSLSGNYAMENADLLIVVGSRAVCQADCSRTGYPNVKQVININSDPEAALHYGKTLALVGDAEATLEALNERLREHGAPFHEGGSDWFAACAQKRAEWNDFKAQRYATHTLFDPVWGREVLTQPAAIHTAASWVMEKIKAGEKMVGYFDAGDVQANGFQIVEPEQPGQFITDGGASYMGFAVSALLATALAEEPYYGVAFSGDGSFTMNPQILLDGVEHGARGCILLFDNRRMAAISGLQTAQYGHDFATHDSVAVDYTAWAEAVPGVLGLHGGYSVAELRLALEKAHSHEGLSLVHIPVYYGPDELGGMGVFGRWNVGNWSQATQALRHKIGL
jgi:3D-(3,5/4)-trihydroxycyclohexane-1,2-dione acylhydrolase (decyclizing)